MNKSFLKTTKFSSIFILAPKVHADWKNYPFKNFNTSRPPVLTIDYSHFGEATLDGSVTYNPRLPGQYQDNDFVYYNGYRYYEPATGRYLQPEPIYQSPDTVIQYAASGYPLNPYTYALSSPLRFVDMDGLRPLSVVEWIQSYFYAYRIFWSWLTGIGPRETNFPSDSAAARILAASEAFEESKSYYKLGMLCKEADPTYKFEPTHGRNAKSFMEMLGNPLWAVTGKFTINFDESGRATLKNTTSLRSAFSPALHLPSYDGHFPGSNVMQTYEVEP